MQSGIQANHKWNVLRRSSWRLTWLLAALALALAGPTVMPPVLKSFWPVASQPTDSRSVLAAAVGAVVLLACLDLLRAVGRPNRSDTSGREEAAALMADASVLAMLLTSDPFAPLALLALIVTVTAAWRRAPAWILALVAFLPAAGLAAGLTARGAPWLDAFVLFLVWFELPVFVRMVVRVGTGQDRATPEEADEDRRRLEGMTDRVPFLVGYLDAAGCYRFANTSYQEWFGRTPPPGMHVRDFLEKPVWRRLEPYFHEALAGKPVSCECTVVLQDGSARLCLMACTPDQSADGPVRGCYVLISDISASRAADEALYETQQRALTALQAIGDAVISTDQDGNVVYLNPVAEIMTDWTVASAAGQPVESVVPWVDAISHQSRAHPVRSALANGQHVGLERGGAIARADGKVLAADASADPIHDSVGRVMGAVMVCHDVSSARALSAQLAHQAQHDTLTGLPNRALLATRTENAIALARRDGRGLALVFIDADNFKTANDTLGHQAGDQLLRQIAERIVSVVRPADTVGRLGGDEFVILLPTIRGPDDAARTAMGILEAMRTPFVIQGSDVHISLSLGISLYPQDGIDAETLIRHADSAMYHAKRAGRNSFHFYTDRIGMAVQNRFEIEGALRQALKEPGRLRVDYQPKVDARTGRVTGAEALVRWQRGPDDIVFPDVFIPIAEDSRLIVELDNWVLRTACEESRRWRTSGSEPIQLAVNLSSPNLATSGFVERVAGILAATGLQPCDLEIEITESAMMHDVNRSMATLSRLRTMGVSIAIDDFGTGYSSLSYLCKLPVDAIKIDRSFVSGAADDAQRAAILGTIVSMARVLRHRVVAEGVETECEAALVAEQGCDEIQGFWFGRAVSGEAMERLLQEQAASPDRSPEENRARIRAWAEDASASG